MSGRKKKFLLYFGMMGRNENQKQRKCPRKEHHSNFLNILDFQFLHTAEIKSNEMLTTSYDFVHLTYFSLSIPYKQMLLLFPNVFKT